MNEIMKMTAQEFHDTVLYLAKVFDIVRAVDPGKAQVITFTADGRQIVAEEYHCYEVWNKSERCRNCVSAAAFRSKSRLSKFEFIGHDIYHVTAKYIVVDDQPCVLEVVEKNSDMALTGVFGHGRFIQQITNYNERVYTDSLTHISNRRFYDEQLNSLEMEAVAMLDIDHFKDINDTYGHLCGDKSLQLVADVIRKCVRHEDSVVRYGGDEFLLAFSVMDKVQFAHRLDTIRKQVEKIVVPEHEDLNVSISIGGAIGHGSVCDLLKVADKELYRAKIKRNDVCVNVVECECTDIEKKEE